MKPDPMFESSDPGCFLTLALPALFVAALALAVRLAGVWL